MRTSLAQNENVYRHEPSPFDVWVRRGLMQRYGHVAREPVPQEFLQLLNEQVPKLRTEPVRSV